MSTLDDIARVAGVSRHTAARILNGKRLEKWPAKREQGDRIRRIAEEMGYRPNISNRTLVLGRFNCVGLLLSTREERSPITQTMLNALDTGLMGRGQHLAVVHLPDQKLADAEYVPGILREWLSDGLIINYHISIPPRMRKLIQDLKMPVVWLNSNFEKDSVYADEYGASCQAVKRLIDFGHRNIAYVDPAFFRQRREGLKHYSSDARRDGCMDAILEAGAQAAFIHDAEKGGGEDFLEALRAIMNSDQRPTGFVCATSEAARAVAETAASLSLRVPQDLSCISFRGESSSASDIWDDSAMVCPECELCSEAARLIMRKIAQPQVEIPSVKLNYSLHEGRTVACRL